MQTTKADAEINEEDGEGEEQTKIPASSHSSTPQPRPKSRAKSNPVPKVETTEVESGEVEELLLGKKKGKGKATESSNKSTMSRSKSRSDVPDESDIEEIPAPKPASKTTKGKSKRKAASPDSVVEVEAPKTKKRAGSEVKDAAPTAKRARSATVSRADSVQPAKKLRRINIFPPPTGPAFNFGAQVCTRALSATAKLIRVQEGASGLNIPTALSPVKESEVPPRASTFSSLSKYTGSIARRA